LYRSSPPLLEIDYPDHLNDPLTDEEGDNTDDDISLADLLEKPIMTTYKKGTNLTGGELLPDHPKKSRVFAQKRKASVMFIGDDEPSR
jgi:hypothetical protein